VTRFPDKGSLLTFHLDESGRLIGAAGAGRLGAIAKEIRVAEKMIAQRLAPDPDALSDQKTPLKAILAERRKSLAVA
jgi:3-phenylpropionate/trans-cinnamate dioxygenase ferredoxin reductase component